MKKNLIAFAAAAALATFSGMASADALTYTYPNFTVNESSVPGVPEVNPFLVTADKLSGTYTEKVTTNGTGGFTASAFANFTGFSLQGSSLPIESYLGGVGTAGYSIYAVFQSVGQIIDQTNFSGLSGSFSLFLDTGKDTVKTLTNGSTAATLTNNTDDYLLASSDNLSYGLGSSIVPRAFEFLFSDLELSTGDQNGAAGTQNGELYFVSPNPFFLSVNVAGNLLGLGVEPNTTYDVTGDIGVSFNEVPEPGSLALLGLGLAGLGFAQRRRNLAK